MWAKAALDIAVGITSLSVKFSKDSTHGQTRSTTLWVHGADDLGSS